MKKIIAISLFSLLSLVACGNGGGGDKPEPSADKLSLVPISESTCRWSKREEGFQFKISPLSILDKHNFANITFSSSESTVNFDKVQGEGEDFKNYVWKATFLEAGDFTISANIDDLSSSNSLTFNVTPEHFIMDCDIPDKYKIDYWAVENQITSNFADNESYSTRYVIYRLNDEYMRCYGIDMTPINFYKKGDGENYNVYSYERDSKIWKLEERTVTKGEVLQELLGELYPNSKTKTEEPKSVRRSTYSIGGVLYNTTEVTYSFGSYNYYDNGGLKVSLKTTTNTNKTFNVSSIDPNNDKFPVNPPEI